MADEARAAAVRMLGAVLGDRRLLSQCEGLLAGLAPADRARAGRLAATVLRQLGPIDAILRPHLQKAPPLAVQNVLRLAVAELAAGEAAHGVVNQAVTLVRAGRHGSTAGLVNAVLRKLADPAPVLPVQRLPRWLRDRLLRAWGKAAVAVIETVQAAPPPVDLTLRAGRPAVPGAEALPTGSLRLAAGVQVSALPGYEAGDWWVQDAAAALAARVLAPAPGERVLDLCAAPGGKTLQLADAGARVTALDISESRLARLRDNLARTGLAAEVVAADALHWQPDAPFDAILLDAPCSATGTIRRHPDLPFVKDSRDLASLLPLQAALIDRALGWLAPGGRLVYCTCSLLPDEGEAQVAAALARHPGLLVDPVLPPGADPAWQTAMGTLRLRPDCWADRGGMDGFFIACLRR